MIEIGVDIGGTFTDVVCRAPGQPVRVMKVPTTRQDPSLAVVESIRRMREDWGLDPHAVTRFVHGTTVGLNALLAGNTARTALVTGRGFADLIEIGRQDRPDLYALHPVKPAPLVPRELRFEIGARQWPDPEDARRLALSEAPSVAELAELGARIARANVESIAVCLLHSYADPRQEERVATALRSLGVPVTTSIRSVTSASARLDGGAGGAPIVRRAPKSSCRPLRRSAHTAMNAPLRSAARPV